jgi:hypothetical protein|tara:strand:+ start:10062 stop:10259 length:198 start_codon:yes stop_codon:yes gene_type:complete
VDEKNKKAIEAGAKIARKREAKRGTGVAPDKATSANSTVRFERAIVAAGSTQSAARHAQWRDAGV